MMRLLLLATGLFLLAACSASNVGGGASSSGNEEAEGPPPPEDVVSAVGTVRHLELEGGFYGIVADDSTKYNPRNLDEEYKEDGLRVRFRAVEKDSTATIQMWGTPIEILDIVKL